MAKLLEPQDIQVEVNRLKEEIKKIQGEMVSLGINPESVDGEDLSTKIESIRKENLKLLKDFDELKMQYLSLRDEEKTLLHERFAGLMKAGYEKDLPEPELPEEPVKTDS